MFIDVRHAGCCSQPAFDLGYTELWDAGKLLERGYSKREQWDEAILYMRRLHRRVKRPLEFTDLMHMDTHGFGEDGHIKAADESIRRRVAIHEAGHAIVGLLVPEHDPVYKVSIMPRTLSLRLP